MSESTSKRVRKAKANARDRKLPNLLVTGTPGTGKSSLSRRLEAELDLGFQWINVGQFAKERGFLGAWDEELECHELEEDPLLDALEEMVAEGGLLLEHHVTDFFPKRYFDLVLVLRTKNDLLHDRLKQRNYNKKKIQSNLECEIFQTVLDEAKECYAEEIVQELRSDTEEEMKANVDRVKSWLDCWKKDNKK